MHEQLNLALRLQHNCFLCSLQGTWTPHPTLHGYNWAPTLSEAHSVSSWSKAKILDWLGYFSFKILSGTWLNFLEIQYKLSSVIENLTATHHCQYTEEKGSKQGSRASQSSVLLSCLQKELNCPCFLGSPSKAAKQLPGSTHWYGNWIFPAELNPCLDWNWT